jgi:hypothetical protein
MVVSGVYKGKNVFVKNPFCTEKNGPGFSVHQVNMNGQISPAEINNEVFEIDLGLLNLKYMDSVKIEIFHKKICSAQMRPAIMNPGALIVFDKLSGQKENHLTVDGEFNWNNLLVMNPFNTKDNSYCIREVKVNGRSITSKLSKDVIEVNLVSLGFKEETKTGLKQGEKVSVEFICSQEGEPFILNPEALVPYR